MPVLGAEADLVGVFKGVFGIYDSADHLGTLYTYDHPVRVEILDAADAEKFYSANGIKRKKSIGDSSIYIARVKKSADLYNTTDPGTDKRTISWYRDQITNGRTIPQVAFEGVDEADSASNKFLRTQFTAFVENINDLSREDGLGAQEVEISGEIITYVKPGHRQAS
jgi:hypothetical protein